MNHTLAQHTHTSSPSLLPLKMSCLFRSVKKLITGIIAPATDAEEEYLFPGEWYHDLVERPVPQLPNLSFTESDLVLELEDEDTPQDTNDSLPGAPPPEVQKTHTLTSFPLFPTLPLDLRLEIWHHTHPPPRHVILSFPQNRRTRARTSDWNKQWIFPSLAYSQFISLLINHESRDFFFSQYLLIFSDFPSNESKKKEGRKAGWYFDPRKDSLCFGDGVRGLRWFMAEFPDEEVWRRVRFVDVDVDLNAFHKLKFADSPGGYFALEENSKVVLRMMRELRLVTLRVVVVRIDQWRNRKNGYWRPWENSGMMVREWLRGRNEGRDVELVMQYIWTEGFGSEGTFVGGSHVTSKQGHEAFLSKYPGTLSDDVRRRWVEMGIFLHDGRNKMHPEYNTEKDIFCRNLVVSLY